MTSCGSYLPNASWRLIILFLGCCSWRVASVPSSQASAIIYQIIYLPGLLKWLFKTHMASAWENQASNLHILNTQYSSYYHCVNLVRVEKEWRSRGSSLWIGKSNSASNPQVMPSGWAASYGKSGRMPGGKAKGVLVGAKKENGRIQEVRPA